MDSIPSFIFSSGSDDDPAGGPRRAKPLVGLLIATVIVSLLTLRVIPMVWPLFMIMIGAILILGLGVMVGAERAARAKGMEAEKRKRGLDGLDNYAAIDRLVDELNDDELTYLRRRIEDREAGASPLPEAMEELLKRTDDRNAGLR